MSRSLAPPTPAPPLSLVLDTNVVLDILVFDDPFSRPLVEALTSGRAIAWADAETLGELEYVLAYPSFALDEAARRTASERYRSLLRMAPEATGAPPPLPRCRDRADQKFLVLAARVGAHWLVSKDKRVLALAGRHDVPFDILTSRRASERLRPTER
ncbi:PIN domain-containing protein [Archangium violaceum]|uniref:PIN domain-containing protein n=1 Tax=Archangium violaceum TaxID=83451 RepID=UPI0019519F1C|nr:PIN domain-containing protein [Archangium violaceum]QRN93433.1 PIN domain-containing protein [Archangium violaceum]